MFRGPQPDHGGKQCDAQRDQDAYHPGDDTFSGDWIVEGRYA